MAQVATARLHSHSLTSTSACKSPHQLSTSNVHTLPSCLIRSSADWTPRFCGVGLKGLSCSRSSLGVKEGRIQCSGAGLPGGPSLDNQKRRLPTLDSPSPYKPLWTPGGFSPGGATSPVEDAASPANAAALAEDEPKTEEEWLARVAQDAAKRKELLEQLRNQLGTWHERVRSMRILQKAGELSAEEVADEARLVGLDSTRLMVAGSVFDSLTDVDSEILRRFEDPDGPVVLYELRTLSVAQRGPVAEYIVANGLDADGARELAKAVKDHERRPEGREGFTEAPGDALAFWYWRMAGETREPEKRARLLEKAAAVAESASAKERVADSS